MPEGVMIKAGSLHVGDVVRVIHGYRIPDGTYEVTGLLREKWYGSAFDTRILRSRDGEITIKLENHTPFEGLIVSLSEKSRWSYAADGRFFDGFADAGEAFRSLVDECPDRSAVLCQIRKGMPMERYRLPLGVFPILRRFRKWEWLNGAFAHNAKFICEQLLQGDVVITECGAWKDDEHGSVMAALTDEKVILRRKEVYANSR